MTPAFTARRRAEEFNSLVENASTRELTDARYVNVLELVEALRHVTPVQARPTFVADLRERLMIAAETALAPSPDAELKARLTVAPRRTPRERRIAVAMGGFAIVGATTSMALAAQTALPGDTLYPLKRALENAQAGVQVDEGDKGSTLLANASGRLEEVDKLSREKRDSATLVIAETLQAFTSQATEASDLMLASYESTGQEASISELRNFAADSMTVLQQLEGLVPDGARSALVQAAQVLTQIDQQAIALCPTCVVKALTEIPDFVFNNATDLLGNVTDNPPAEPTSATGPGQGGKPGGGGNRGTAQPSDEPTPVAPTRPPVIAQPGTPAPGEAPAGNDDDDDPITDLTDGLTGGGSAPAPAMPADQPDLGEVLDDTVGGVLGELD
ncbi:DUF5667 domain-containing protein [Nocardioides psychrotolerans]|uniref:DUF5667 domain-containing protein n=1 Tax=Nocardioides psychrotolerans TaxID=1005945 RepID=A0A1I3MSQ9_9ACTN|nr:DUF5667 domain-containing protein [Nocardioides psychrotolerans]SFI99989.1 hypothetical protein SAMN05216561_11624 [Nocardioides psychrotolerans]